MPIIAMGTLDAALAGAGTGGAQGAIVGRLLGYCIPEERARLYDRGVREGGMVGLTPRCEEDASISSASGRVVVASRSTAQLFRSLTLRKRMS